MRGAVLSLAGGNYSGISPRSVARAVASFAPPSDVVEVVDGGVEWLSASSMDLSLASVRMRSRRALEKLGLFGNQIGDEGVAALVAPGKDVLKSLQYLSLRSNPNITDEGCAALTAALRDGRLPKLGRVFLNETSVSNGAKEALKNAKTGLQVM